ncbi:MAG TPA: cyanophycinase, partial [Chthoniobacterales bacterium]|nr:cyanophycinase [Chthoniobacterales bacterium]
LIVIGGREDKIGDALILREVARHVGNGKLVVTAVASNEPESLFEEYDEVFRKIGVKQVVNLEVASREDASNPEMLRVLDGANAVFFTGGDQLKITSQIGGTPVYDRIRQIYNKGGVVAGTSAGASVVCGTMLAAGTGRTSPRLGESVQMAPGLGFIRNVIIDQHFAERGRMGRLLAAVAQNPRTLGLGIDENTAVVIDKAESFYVVGAGAVYAVDGRYISYSNVTEAEAEKTLAVYDIKLHVLTEGDSFDLNTRRPTSFGAIQHIRTLEAAAHPD